MPRRPVATYRLQFTPEFGFRDAIALVPYLDQLGVSHIYASPLLKPASGSMHGYDVVDPTSLNPDLGEEHEFQELLQELTRRDMGLILDIVPNHMAVNSQNVWWQDVLEHGPRSRFAHYFDIDWERGGGRVVLPALGDHFGAVLENNELSLAIDQQGLAIRYYEQRFPVDPSSYRQVLSEVRRDPGGAGRGGDSDSATELETLIDLSHELDSEAGNPEELQRVAGHIGRRTWNLYCSSGPIRESFERAITSFNGSGGGGDRFNRLARLLDAQQFRLSYWRRASEEINYRRFFDIADLVSLRIEDPEVFEAVHSLVLEYAGTAGVDGFRADHVDGLFDPEGYAHRLQQRLTEESGGRSDFLLLFEKILTGHERLPGGWPISGTTGYEFAHRINALLADPAGFQRIETRYAELTGLDRGFLAIVHSNKAKVLDDLFAGEFHALVDSLNGIARSERNSRDLSRRQLTIALRDVMIHLPVYRTYAGGDGVDQRDRQILQESLDRAAETVSGVEDQVWTFLRSIFLLDGNDPAIEQRIAWLRRWQQFTGPLMAKGLEDTALYVYTPLTSLNEVGGEPETLAPEDLHAHNRHVAANWPETMLTTSTHDTKRSEDVRARIGVLSEFADEWLRYLDRWMKENAGLREVVNGVAVPDANEEQLIYQTLLGAWPLERSGFGTFRDRISEYLTKAMREAKIHTSWIAVNAEHEKAVLRFVDRILDAGSGSAFFREIVAFQTRIGSYGAWNSLAQLVLKLTSPGFPDIYQGNELWDFSLADPDNRRTVDYSLRRQYLEQFDSLESSELPRLIEQWRDGRIKMLVTARILRDRRAHPEPFGSGDYIPLSIEGEAAGHLVAFGRRYGDQWAISVVPRLTAHLVRPEDAPIGEAVWGDSQIILPGSAPSTWVDIISGRAVETTDGRLRTADALSTLPVAVLRQAN